MRRFRLLIPIFLVVTWPAVGQTSGTDSQTLRALLEEVRLLRHEIEVSMVATQRAQILIYRLEIQQTSVARAAQRLDEARAKLAETQSNRAKLAQEIKLNEDGLARTDNPDLDRKMVEEGLISLRAGLAQLQVDEQERQARETEADDRFHLESAKLAELQSELDKLDKALGKASDELRR